ncbi:FAD-binding protein [Isoptericola halotolerans]|uniref:FAD-binding oxidoreductase n=1 Tax=Isoptericola halotolerans TaxID=300560 RepID=UPI0038902263
MTSLTLPTTFAASLTGQLHLPGEPGFARAATPWNLAVSQPVAAVVEAADAADVATTVRQARAAGLSVTAQSTGHGATGDVVGTVLLRTGRLDSVEVDPVARTARVGAGATWAAVRAQAAPHGLTGLLGSAPGVGVTGYTLGGGLGWFSRAHGLAADHVRSLDVVDTDGAARRVTADSDPELFWALRGGGGDLAVVTSLELDLVPVPALTGGRIVWPADGPTTAAVLDAYRTATAAAPRETSLWLTRVEAPGAPPVVVVHVAHLGDPPSAAKALRPFGTVGGALAHAVGPVALADVGAITDDPTEPAAGRSRAELLTGIDDDAVTALFTEPVAPLLLLQLRHLGGALATPGPDAGALGALTEPYLLYAFGLAFSPELSDAVGHRLAALPGELRTVTSGRKPTSFLAPGERAAAAFAPDSMARLQDLKRARDPHGVVRGAYPLLA